MSAQPKPEPRAVVKARATRQAMKDARAVYAVVTERDGGWCRHCHEPAQHRHHIIFRSHNRQGTTTANVCLLCVKCHNKVHARRMVISGDANGSL